MQDATTTIEQALARLDWADIGAELDREGYAVVPALLNEDQVSRLAEPGTGDHPMTSALREGFYMHLVVVANRWSGVLGEPLCFPASLDAFLGVRRDDRVHAASHTTRLREGEHEGLHQWANGARVFPLQLAAVLNTPGEDFTGGEFVMTEQ